MDMKFKQFKALNDLKAFCAENKLRDFNKEYSYESFGSIVDDNNVEVACYYPKHFFETQNLLLQDIMFILFWTYRKDCNKFIPKPIEYYINLGHMGPKYWIKEMIPDATKFTLEELKEHISNKDLYISCRITALFMIGARWDRDTLLDVCYLLKKNPELNKDMDCLLDKFYLVDNAEKYISELEEENIIDSKIAQQIFGNMRSNKKLNFSPLKSIGIANYKKSLYLTEN